MTTYYATPAAANYYSPPTHSHRQRGVRVCDTCGSTEQQPTVKPFRLCGGCVRALPSRYFSSQLLTLYSDVMQMTTNYCVSRFQVAMVACDH
jgi:ribosomal protein S14